MNEYNNNNNNNNNNQLQSHLESRVSTVEKAIAGLTEQVLSLSKSVEQIVESNKNDHQQTRREIQNLSQIINVSGKTNWNVVFAGLSLVFTLTGALVWFVVATVRPVQMQTSQNEVAIEKRLSELPQESYDRGFQQAYVEIARKDIEMIKDFIHQNESQDKNL